MTAMWMSRDGWRNSAQAACWQRRGLGSFLFPPEEGHSTLDRAPPAAEATCRSGDQRDDGFANSAAIRAAVAGSAFSSRCIAPRAWSASEALFWFFTSLILAAISF